MEDADSVGQGARKLRMIAVRIAAGVAALALAVIAAAAPPAASCALQSRSMPFAGGTIAYDEVGRGAPVVLVHGLFANKEQWHALACLLAARGYRAVAPDLPGFGASVGYAISAYRLEMQATLLQAFLRKLGLARYHLAGNSMGGAIAAMVAARFPGEVASLAFIGAPLGVVGWNGPLRDAIFAGSNPFIPVTPEQLDVELRLLFVHPPTLDAAAKTAIVRNYAADNLHYVQVWNIVDLYGDVLLSHPPPTRHVLILWGEEDRVYGAHGAPRLRQAIRGSEMHVLEGAGHLLHVERPDTALRYLVPLLERAGITAAASP